MPLETAWSIFLIAALTRQALSVEFSTMFVCAFFIAVFSADFNDLFLNVFLAITLTLFLADFMFGKVFPPLLCLIATIYVTTKLKKNQVLKTIF